MSAPRGAPRGNPRGAAPESLASLMHAAADVARLAGDVALRYYGRHGRGADGLAVETKVDGSPVTAADRAAARAARVWIEARFPADGVLGE